MAVVLVTAPTILPVSVKEVKAQSRVDWVDDDPEIAAFIRSAVAQVELFTGQILITTVFDFFADAFPTDVFHIGNVPWGRRHDAIIVPNPPLASIDTFSYIDTDGNSQPLVEDTDFRVDLKSRPARLTPEFNTSWPSARNITNAVTFQFTAGNTTAALVPFNAKQVVKMLAADLYEHREAQDEVRLEDNKTYINMLWGLRIVEAV